jgi:hypothetical protein
VIWLHRRLNQPTENTVTDLARTYGSAGSHRRKCDAECDCPSRHVSKLQLFLGKYQGTVEDRAPSAGEMGQGRGHRVRFHDNSAELQSFLVESEEDGRVDAPWFLYIIARDHSTDGCSSDRFSRTEEQPKVLCDLVKARLRRGKSNCGVSVVRRVRTRTWC